MSIYAIGDLQGCHAEFVALLERLDFDPARDCLWLAGDLVNRGPGSLACLREVMALKDAARVVLGNHDLHLLAVARGGGSLNWSDTLEDILVAPDREALLDWLQARPLVIRDGDRLMSHAGILPQWYLDQAETLGKEVQAELNADNSGAFLERMYGNDPACWRDDLDGVPRRRMIINVLTRMRFINDQGCLDFKAKEGLELAPEGFAPWFSFPRQDDAQLLFGHWAALEGSTPGSRVNAEALDTGCVWGGSLTALNLESGERISVPSRQPRH